MFAPQYADAAPAGAAAPDATQIATSAAATMFRARVTIPLTPRVLRCFGPGTLLDEAGSPASTTPATESTFVQIGTRSFHGFSLQCAYSQRNQSSF